MENLSEENRDKLRRAIGHLGRAVYHIELAREWIKPVPDQAERWERIRALDLALFDELNGLRDTAHCHCGL